MASEITVTLWTDATVDSSTAHSLAREASASLHRATGLATAVADFAARTVSPTDIVPVPAKPRRFRSKKAAAPKA